MAHTNKVLRSINQEGALVCVDVFVRPNGTFGFEEYRRDPEDLRGWFIVGHFEQREFATVDEALLAARNAIGWLDEVLGRI